jgi:hypothetical protein
MKLTKMLDMVSSSISFMDLEPSLNGFEVQRATGRLKSAMIEKQSVEFWLFLAMERLRDGWDELEKYMHRDVEFFLHSVIGGRF